MNFNLFLCILSIILINSTNAFKSLECNHLSPFMWNKLPLSVDLAKLNLFPEREDLFSRNGFKDSIFNLTCKQNIKFELANVIIRNENITYHLPDHMRIRNLEKYVDPYFVNEVAHRVFEQDEESYRRNMMRTLNVTNLDDEEKAILKEFGYTSDIDSLYIGAFKLNNNYQRIRKERFTNRRIPIETRLNITGYLIEVDDRKIALTNAFQHEIRHLPSNYEDSKAKYESLISTFGTHYFQYYVVGGQAKASFRILDEVPVQLDQLSEDGFKNDRPFDFDDLSGLRFDVDENFASNEKYFLSDGKLHKRTINFYGGRIEARNHTLKKWKPSVVLGKIG